MVLSWELEMAGVDGADLPGKAGCRGRCRMRLVWFRIGTDGQLETTRTEEGAEKLESRDEPRGHK